MLIASSACLVSPNQSGLAIELEPVKLDLSYLRLLSKEQLQEYNLLLTILSHFEARLENCGIFPEFERRVRIAARNCVTPEALDHIAKIYRSKKEFMANGIKEDAKSAVGNSRIDCAKDSEKKWLREVKKHIDNQVEEVAQACRACPIC